MKNLSVCFTVFFFLCFDSSFAQNNEISIRFVGNSGFYMTDGKLDVYIDFPYKSGAHHYMEYDDEELENIKENSVFLFTHKHADHYSKKLIRNLNGKFFGPFKFPKEKRIELADLNNLDPDFSVETFDTSHNFTFGKHYSYLITWHGKKIFVSGDTGDYEDWSKMENLDWSLTNFWIYRNAIEDKAVINSKIIGICHLYPDAKIESAFPENIHFFLKQNEVVSIRY